MGQQGAQARRGCRRRPSAEALRRSALRSAGPSAELRTACPGACTLSAAEDADADRRAWCWGSSAPTPAQERGACPCVRSCLCARVSTDLLLLPGPVRLRASSKMLPDFTIFSWKGSQPRLLVICQRPLPASFTLLPSPPPTVPRTTLHCALSCGAGPAPRLPKWQGRGCDPTGEGLREASPAR